VSSKSGGQEGGRKIIARNRKARYEYEVLETFEAGVVLKGTEVKSLRQGRGSLTGSHASIENGEVWLQDVNIPQYEMGNRYNHEPKRPRKLLLHKREIDRIFGKVAEKGLTLVPLSIYFTRGRVKVDLGMCRGKKAYDKREAIKKRDQARDLDQQMKNY
jgi:SsrA-binding protein